MSQNLPSDAVVIGALRVNTSYYYPFWFQTVSGISDSKTVLIPLWFLVFRSSQGNYLRNRSALAVNWWVIIHCLEVSCKEDQITSAQCEWFIFVQLTNKQWIITQQFTLWSWSISILTHNKWRKHIWRLQLLPTLSHCTEELQPILRLRCIPLRIFVMSFKRKNDVT